jgi:DNA-binding NarL/FixJ family response regulator
MAIRTMVVEDDSFTRLTVVGALRHAGIDVVADCDNSRDALAQFQACRPKVCVIDLDLGSGPTGVDVAAALRRLDPAVGVVLLTSYEDPRLMSPSLRRLPEGTRYVVKQAMSDMDMLIAAIESAAEHPRQDVVSGRSADLTDTQVEILRLVATGLSNSEIARIRVVEEKTVEQAIRRTAKRLGIHGSKKVNQRVALARTYYQLIGATASLGSKQAIDE